METNEHEKEQNATSHDNPYEQYKIHLENIIEIYRTVAASTPPDYTPMVFGAAFNMYLEVAFNNR